MDITFIPRWILINLSKDYSRQLDINVLISNTIIVLVFYFFSNQLLNWLSVLPHFCLIDKLFHVECPACGTTRSFIGLANGNFQDVLILNFASILVAVFLIIQIPVRIISLLFNKLHTKLNRFSNYFGKAIIISLLINWVYRILT